MLVIAFGVFLLLPLVLLLVSLTRTAVDVNRGQAGMEDAPAAVVTRVAPAPALRPEPVAVVDDAPEADEAPKRASRRFRRRRGGERNDYFGDALATSSRLRDAPHRPAAAPVEATADAAPLTPRPVAIPLVTPPSAAPAATAVHRLIAPVAAQAYRVPVGS